MARRFGPSQEAYDRALAFLERSGFTLVEGSANRLTLTVRGTRSQAERAFAVEIHDYRLDDRTLYANDRDPALPAPKSLRTFRRWSDCRTWRGLTRPSNGSKSSSVGL